jgi:eukaryotic-like serine/threonine-protein kinase
MQFPNIPGFTVHRLQGSGSVGQVFEATLDKKQRCALKMLKPSAVQEEYVEWGLGRLVGQRMHPNLAAVFGFHVASEPKFIASEWAGNASGFVQTLSSMCGKWTFADQVIALRSVASGLVALHSLGLIHTALTLSNILLEQQDRPESALITDVAQGCIDLEGQPVDWGTHLPYFSLERLRPEQEAKADESGETLDIYAFGVLAYKLMTDNWPRAQKSLEALERSKTRPIAKDILELARQLERENQVGWKSKAATPEEATLRRVVEKCLALKPENRYRTMSEVLAAMPASDSDVEEASPELLTRGEQKVMRLSRKASEVQQNKAATPPAAAAVIAPPQAPATTAPAKPTPAGGYPKNWTLGAAGAAIAGLGLAGLLFTKNSGLKTQLAEKDKALATLQSEQATVTDKVSATEKAKTEALANQAKAESNLRLQQQQTGKLFDSFIEYIPDDPIRRGLWREQVANYAERTTRFLEQHANDPSQKQTTAIARWHLGATAQAMGDVTQAETYYDECAVAIDSILASYTGPAEANLWLPLQAKVLSCRGQLHLENSRLAEAEQALNESLKAADQWLKTQSNDTAAARERINALTLISRVLKQKAEATGALEQLTRAVKEMDDLMQTPARRDDDVITLAKLHAERGQSLAELKKYDDALAAFRKAHETLRDFDRKHSRYRYSREVLAEIYGQFAQVASRNGTVDEGTEPAKEASILWADLAKEDPSSESYQLEHGRAQLILAKMLRVGQKPEEAKAAAGEGTVILEALTNRKRGETRYRLHLGIGRALVAELFEDQTKWNEAAKNAGNATEILSEAGIEAGASVAEHREAMVSLAKAYTTLGHAANNSKQKDIAKDSYLKAQEAWQQVVADGGETEAIKSSIEFVRKELEGFKG